MKPPGGPQTRPDPPVWIVKMPPLKPKNPIDSTFTQMNSSMCLRLCSAANATSTINWIFSTFDSCSQEPAGSIATAVVRHIQSTSSVSAMTGGSRGIFSLSRPRTSEISVAPAATAANGA